MSKEETVEITIRVPQGIVDFLKDMEKILGMTVKEYIVYNLAGVVVADLDEGSVFFDPQRFAEKYRLTSFFKEQDISIPWEDS